MRQETSDSSTFQTVLQFIRCFYASARLNLKMFFQNCITLQMEFLLIQKPATEFIGQNCIVVQMEFLRNHKPKFEGVCQNYITAHVEFLCIKILEIEVNCQTVSEFRWSFYASRT